MHMQWLPGSLSPPPREPGDVAILGVADKNTRFVVLMALVKCPEAGA